MVLCRLEGAPLLGNRWLALAVLYSPLGGLFDVRALGWREWLVLLGGVALGLAAQLQVARWSARRLGEL